MKTHWTDRLSEYLDGELTPAEQAACASHLASCDTCRGLLDELQMVVTTARADVDRDPEADLWPGIVHRIGPPSPIGAPWRSRRQVVLTLPQLALAASLLIAVSAGVAYVAAGRSTTTGVVPEHAVQAYAEPLLPMSADVERANFADAEFDQAVADLESVLSDLRDELHPQTVMVIERNLATIDEAIREAREALDRDPANTFLNSHLAEARRKKLDLLRHATMMQSSSGD